MKYQDFEISYAWRLQTPQLEHRRCSDETSAPSSINDTVPYVVGHPALLTLQVNITTSLDTCIHDAMQQQSEQLQTWMQQQLGEVVASITTSGQTRYQYSVLSYGHIASRAH